MVVFTEEEKKEIRSALAKIHSEIREMFNGCGSNYLFVNTRGFFSSIKIEKDDIEIHRRHANENYLIEKEGNFTPPSSDREYSSAATFIKDYQMYNRKKIVDAVSEKNKAKEELLKYIEKINLEESIDECKESVIEVSFPEQSSCNKLEVKDENGKMIGMMLFGNHIVRIVTNGDVVLTNCKEQTDTNKNGK